MHILSACCMHILHEEGKDGPLREAAMSADISTATRMIKAPVEWMGGSRSAMKGLHGGGDT